MSNCIYNKFSSYKVAILLLRDKDPIRSKVHSLFHLQFNIRNSLFNLFQNTTFKRYVLDYIHILSNQGSISIIPNKTNRSLWKKHLRIFSKK